MKTTGMVRKLDKLGRIVLPIEIRRGLNIDVGDPIEIFIDEKQVILQKYEPCDIFTGSMDELYEYKGRKISKETIIELAKMAELV